MHVRNKLQQLSKEDSMRISDLYYNYHISIEQLAKMEEKFQNELLGVLWSKNPQHFFKTKELSSISLPGDSLLVLSDTHIGSNKMNMDYIIEAYKYARVNKINHILHLGDLMQSTMCGVQNSLRNEERQINFILNHYPYYKKIKTHILLGNHDYKTLMKNKVYLEMLKSRRDFNLLGFKRCYITWQGKLLSLNHPIEHYHLNLPYKNDTTLNLYGHRHGLLVKNNCIYLPTLSDDLKHYGKEKIEPGWIVLQKENATLRIENYRIQEKNPELLLVRKL